MEDLTKYIHNYTILSLFDYSGAWCAPYKEAGYTTVQIDLKLNKDVLEVKPDDFPEGVRGILAAPPCTHFSLSGAQYWKAKDGDGRTEQALALVDHVLFLVEELRPKWWVLENPVGRLAKLRPDSLGKPAMYFQPYHYGDPYSKKTGLWGDFNTNLPRDEVEPIRVCEQGSWLQKLGGSSERTKELRSMTPEGFAKAFFRANP
jgi:hypothetical protein